MSSVHHSEKESLPQGVNWNEEDWQALLTRLPSDWEEQAIKLKAWQRVRKLAKVADLLRALLVYAACGYSFRKLGWWATVVGIGSLSERAWRKRVERSQEWIEWILKAMLRIYETPSWLPEWIGRILFQDASRLSTPAGSGEDVKMHTTYDLRAGSLASMQVEDRHSSEGLHHVSLRQNDIVVTDAGYKLGTSVRLEQEQGAYGVHRFSHHQVRLEREDGKKVDLKRLVKHQHYGTIKEYTLWVREGKQPERVKIRVIISLPPRAQAMQARARKRERIRLKKGPKANMAPAWWAGVMLLGTTLPKEQWSAVDIVKLYRARWQIELFFKRLKQGLMLHLVPVKEWERARAYVHLCVLSWLLQAQNAQELREELMQLLKEPEVGVLEETEEETGALSGWVISRWMLEDTTLETLQTLLRGMWTQQRIRDCLPELQRYLTSRDRPKRRSQEKEVQQWLLRRHTLLLKEAIVV